MLAEVRQTIEWYISQTSRLNGILMIAIPACEFSWTLWDWARENCEAPGLIINRRARSGMPRHELNWNHDISQVRSSWQVKWHSAQNVRRISDPEKSHLFIAQLKVEILMSDFSLNDLQTRMAHKHSFKCMHTWKSTIQHSILATFQRSFERFIVKINLLAKSVQTRIHFSWLRIDDKDGTVDWVTSLEWIHVFASARWNQIYGMKTLPASLRRQPHFSFLFRFIQALQRQREKSMETHFNS